MSEAFLSLGSNMGDRILNIQKAIESIRRIPESKIIKISSLYETEPFGVNDIQNKYINCCLKISTMLSSEILMGCCLGIESSLERVRKYKFSPRTIDIDILTFDNEIKNKKNLTLPHPEFIKRAFVLIPLKEICEKEVLSNINISESLKICDISTVKKITI